jgi:ABC-type antimicrobial peptide transport system permease subunit
MTALGFALGLVGSVGVARFLAHFLFGVQPSDAASLLIVTAVLSLTALAASLVPALRASDLDPMSSLRAE